MIKANFSEISKNDIQSVAFQGSLLAKNLKIRELRINSKTFHYWKMNGLISTLNKREWAEISFIEYLWIKVLDSMRGFGCSIKLMQKIYYEQFIKAYEENLGSKTLEDNIAFYKSLSKMRDLTLDEQQKLEQSEKTLNDPFATIALRSEISHFYQRVLECINHRHETGIVIYPDETYTIYGYGRDADFNRPHIFIPFSFFIAELFADESKDKFVEALNIYSEDELRLVKEIRNSNADKVTISFDKVSGRPSSIEFDKTGLVQGDKAKEIMRILGLRNYSSINLKTRTGTSLSFTKSEKMFM